MQKSGLIYLATPYSHPDDAVRLQRFETVNRVAAELMADGYHIFSPISHSRPIALAGDLPQYWEFWEEYDNEILQACTGMFVLRQDGWEESVGVTAERVIATCLGIPIEYLDP